METELGLCDRASFLRLASVKYFVRWRTVRGMCNVGCRSSWRVAVEVWLCYSGSRVVAAWAEFLVFVCKRVVSLRLQLRYILLLANVGGLSFRASSLVPVSLHVKSSQDQYGPMVLFRIVYRSIAASTYILIQFWLMCSRECVLVKKRRRETFYFCTFTNFTRSNLTDHRSRHNLMWTRFRGVVLCLIIWSHGRVHLSCSWKFYIMLKNSIFALCRLAGLKM